MVCLAQAAKHGRKIKKRRMYKHCPCKYCTRSYTYMIKTKEQDWTRTNGQQIQAGGRTFTILIMFGQRPSSEEEQQEELADEGVAKEETEEEKHEVEKEKDNEDEDVDVEN